MSTDDSTTAGTPAEPVVAIDAARAAWFTGRGYTGKDGEEVHLRGKFGTAMAEDVWRIRCGLERLRTDFEGAFMRLVSSAHLQMRPVDPAHRLCENSYGALTDYTSGEWRDGACAIVAALTEPSEEFDAEFAPAPLKRNEAPESEASKAA